MSTQRFDRRAFLRNNAAGLALTAVGRRGWGAETSAFPPTRVITRGPKHHWFGYYDKLQFDPTGRYVLGMEVDFEHRSPTAADVIKIGMVDLHDNDRWIELGQSTAWCWQQGCMLQWVPGSKTKVLWNDREGDHYVCHILDVHTGEKRTIPHPIYSVSPDGKSAVAPDFRRIQYVRPGYGYPGLSDPYLDDLAPRDTGIFHVDLESGESKLIISLADVVRLKNIPKPTLGIKHYFNHLLFNPDGSRFIALHRWHHPDGSLLSRMISAKPDGSDIRIVIGNGYVSHFIWRDAEHILSESRRPNGNPEWGIFLFEDKDGGGNVEEVGRGVLNSLGHISYLPGNEWILSDTYPQGESRMQTPHLYHVRTKRRIDLGHFHSPSSYTDEWRVDTHPRLSPDGRHVCIDSPHKNEGRQLYLIDISKIVG